MMLNRLKTLLDLEPDDPYLRFCMNNRELFLLNLSPYLSTRDMELAIYEFTKKYTNMFKFPSRKLKCMAAHLFSKTAIEYNNFSLEEIIYERNLCDQFVAYRRSLLSENKTQNQRLRMLLLKFVQEFTNSVCSGSPNWTAFYKAELSLLIAINNGVIIWNPEEYKIFYQSFDVFYTYIEEYFIKKGPPDVTITSYAFNGSEWEEVVKCVTAFKKKYLANPYTSSIILRDKLATVSCSEPLKFFIKDLSNFIVVYKQTPVQLQYQALTTFNELKSQGTDLGFMALYTEGTLEDVDLRLCRGLRLAFDNRTILYYKYTWLLDEIERQVSESSTCRSTQTLEYINLALSRIELLYKAGIITERYYIEQSNLLKRMR